MRSVSRRVNGYAQSRCRDLAAAQSPWSRRKSPVAYRFPFRSTSEWGIGAANARSANWAAKIPALSTAGHTPPSRACFAKANQLREKVRAKAKTLERRFVHKSDRALTPCGRGRQVPTGWLAFGNEGAIFAQGAANRLRRDRRIGVHGGHARGGGEIGVGNARWRRSAGSHVQRQRVAGGVSRLSYIHFLVDFRRVGQAIAWRLGSRA
jgi:hypothetical protein